MRYEAHLQFDPESRHYIGTIADLPIVVDARSRAEAIRMLKQAIVFSFEEEPVLSRRPPLAPEPGAEVVLIDV